MKKKVFATILVGVISFLIILGGIFLIFYQRPALTCGDGTIYGACSLNQPYLCVNGTLVERASSCGCQNISFVDGETCFAEYKTGAKNISLNYTLNGVAGKIDFVVYKNLSNYLASLPRYLTSKGENAVSLLDFRLKSLNEKNQRKLLIPLAVAIKNAAQNSDDQARIAISLVQNIPFGSSNKTRNFLGVEIEYYRYPYEVLYDMKGVCGEKSALLIFLLRELGYGTAFLYYAPENHEVTGIRCPVEKSLAETGYCFIETTGPSIITDSNTEYLEGTLESFPQVMPISGNALFGEKNFYEYKDAKKLDSIREVSQEYGAINYIEHLQFAKLTKKYGLANFE